MLHFLMSGFQFCKGLPKKTKASNARPDAATMIRMSVVYGVSQHTFGLYFRYL